MRTPLVSLTALWIGAANAFPVAPEDANIAIEDYTAATRYDPPKIPTAMFSSVPIAKPQQGQNRQGQNSRDAPNGWSSPSQPQPWSTSGQSQADMPWVPYPSPIPSGPAGWRGSGSRGSPLAPSPSKGSPAGWAELGDVLAPVPSQPRATPVWGAGVPSSAQPASPKGWGGSQAAQPKGWNGNGVPSSSPEWAQAPAPIPAFDSLPSQGTGWSNPRPAPSAPKPASPEPQSTSYSTPWSAVPDEDKPKEIPSLDAAQSTSSTETQSDPNVRPERVDPFPFPKPAVYVAPQEQQTQSDQAPKPAVYVPSQEQRAQPELVPQWVDISPSGDD